MNGRDGGLLLDLGIGVLLVTGGSFPGMAIGAAVGASSQERNWAMLYLVAFVGAIASFGSLLGLIRVSRLLQEQVNREEAEER